jgi:hypothetical protein
MAMATVSLAQPKAEEHVVNNAQYRMFVHYVRDSIARKILGEEVSGSFVMKNNPDRINWKKKIDWAGTRYREALNQLYYSEGEQFNHNMQIETRWMNFEYTDNDVKTTLNIYPDTLVWMRNADAPETISGSYAHCVTYNWHPYFDEYPVMGISDAQRKAYLFWLNNHRAGKGIKTNAGVEYIISRKRDLEENEKRGITVSVEPAVLWNINEDTYKAFVNYVRDSLARRILGANLSETTYFNLTNEYNEQVSPPTLRWDMPVPWDGVKEKEVLKVMYAQQADGMSSHKVFDVRKLNFEYYRMDLLSAAEQENEPNRSVFILRNIVNVYPDTAILTTGEGVEYDVKMDVGDPYGYQQEKLSGYGINYYQAEAFYLWRNRHFSKGVSKNLMPFEMYLLPSRQEWESLAKGKMPEKLTYDIEFPGERFCYTIRKKSK